MRQPPHTNTCRHPSAKNTSCEREGRSLLLRQFFTGKFRSRFVWEAPRITMELQQSSQVDSKPRNTIESEGSKPTLLGQARSMRAWKRHIPRGWRNLNRAQKYRREKDVAEFSATPHRNSMGCSALSNVSALPTVGCNHLYHRHTKHLYFYTV